MHDAVPAIAALGVSPIVRIPDMQGWMVKRKPTQIVLVIESNESQARWTAGRMVYVVYQSWNKTPTNHPDRGSSPQDRRRGEAARQVYQIPAYG
jgi:hypothetical protein